MPSNEVRNIDPERDRRLAVIREALAASGPDGPADILAEGYVARLYRRVYAQLNDDVGTADDVETLCGWSGAPRVLSLAMIRAGYLKPIGGRLVCVGAMTEAPEYIRARWRRADRQSYNRAMRRAIRAPLASDGTGNTEADMNGAEKHVGRKGFQEVIDFWHQRYLDAYGRKYIFKPIDFRSVASILDATGGDTDAATGVLQRFLKDRFFAGHELRHAWQNINRYTGAGPQRPGDKPSLRSTADTDRAKL